MTKPRAEPSGTLPMLPPLPGWIAAASAETLDAAAFRSGAALAHLSQATASVDVPMALLRDRLALASAQACVRHSGRTEGAMALRDALHLTQVGDDPGPAGRVFRLWSRAVARPISAANLAKALERMTAERIADCLDATGPTPLDRAAQAIESALTENPRAETAALILADAVLANALGWTHVLPLLSPALTTRDLRLRGDALRMACHLAVLVGVGQALAVAGEVTRAATRLRDVAPQLRAKTAARAVDLFLAHDALAPAALDFMSDRAARRLCDRLVTLGALRELTGRDSFRLYGV